MNEEQVPLSAAGALRREEILALARMQARQRRQHRWAGHAGVYILLAATAALFLRHPSTRETALFTPSVPASQPSAIAPPAQATIAYIPTDPGIAQRLSTHPQSPAWTSVNDDQLLHLLAQSGHPAGLIRVQGHAILLPR